MNCKYQNSAVVGVGNKQFAGERIDYYPGRLGEAVEFDTILAKACLNEAPRRDHKHLGKLRVGSVHRTVGRGGNIWLVPYFLTLPRR